MNPWISTTWKSPEEKSKEPDAQVKNQPLVRPPLCPSDQRVPLEILSRILDHYQPQYNAKDRQTLSRLLRVFKAHSDDIATRLYRTFDLQWAYKRGLRPNPFNVTKTTDPHLWIELAAELDPPAAEVDALRALIDKVPSNLPRPRDAHIQLCRWLTVTLVDLEILWLICRKASSLKVLHFGLSTGDIEYHRKAMIGNDPYYNNDTMVTRSIRYCAELSAHTLLVDVKFPSQMAAHVQPILSSKSTLYKSLRRLVVRTGPWETILNDSTPFALPFVKYAPPKDFEELVILHQPEDPRNPAGRSPFEPNFQGPATHYSDAFLANFLCQQFHRRTHKKVMKVTIVGLEYASSSFHKGFDDRVAEKVDVSFRAGVLESIKPKDNVEDVKKRLECWKLITLADYSQGLVGMDKNILQPYMWDALERASARAQAQSASAASASRSGSGPLSSDEVAMLFGAGPGGKLSE